MTDRGANAGEQVVGLLLAGGSARRMGGGDKCLRRLGGRTLLEIVRDRLAPQVGPMVLSANGEAARFAAFGLPVVADQAPGGQGPLAGILSGLEWARDNAPRAGWLLSVPTDAPFIPPDLVARLVVPCRKGDADMACAASGGRRHPVIALWPLSIAPALSQALLGDGIRKIDRFTGAWRVAAVDWPSTPHDPFFNANRPDDLAIAEEMIGE